jgi:acyl-coenzyme A thioesterase PaaI-like protein
MPESWTTRLTRWGFNLHPTYWSTGGRVSYISADWHEVRVRLPLSWRTRNYVGTLFGGAMYSAVDPFYMIMLIKILGPSYTVWDKAAAIRFRRPARGALAARFVVEPSVVAAIREELRKSPKVDRVFTVDLVGSDGIVHASVEKTLHVSLADGAENQGRAVSSLGA